MGMHADDRAYRFRGQYTERDIEALAQFTVSQFLDKRLGRATVSAVILLAVAAVLFRSWIVMIAGFAVILGVSALVRYVILPRRLIHHARQMAGTAGSHEITMEQNGIRHRRDDQEQYIERSAISRIVLHKAHLFILLKPAGCLMLPLDWILPPATIEGVAKRLVGRDDA
jgi:hypothetical protein